MRRRAFTLVELLIVIVLIGILVAILLPAIASAYRRAKEATVATELNGLSTALTSFSNQRGAYPPSRFIASETGDYSMAHLAAPGTLRDEVAAGLYGVAWSGLNPAQLAIATAQMQSVALRSVEAIRKFWPRTTVSLSGPVPNIPGLGFYDFNGDGDIDPPTLLGGSECLAFFLGGIPKTFQSTSGDRKFGMVGFAKVLKNPFLPEIYTDPVTLKLVTPPREAPNAEFKSARLYDPDADGIPWYGDVMSTDGIPAPIVYFLAQGGAYDPADENLFKEPNGDPIPSGAYLDPPFATVFDVNKNPTYAGSLGPNPYTASSPYPTVGVNYATATLGATGTYSTTFINRESFQLITAGNDRMFGPGGWYDPQGSATRVPLARPAHQALIGKVIGNDYRYGERDNITNFASGRLD